MPIYWTPEDVRPHPCPTEITIACVICGAAVRLVELWAHEQTHRIDHPHKETSHDHRPPDDHATH